jgi:hypothetical protein
LRNSRTYSNATAVDLSKYDTRTVGSYYSVPLLEVFKCPEVEGLTKQQKQNFINAYITKINKYWKQLQHNLKQAKAYENDEKLKNTTRHYNYHLAQRTQAQKCNDIIIYGGDTATIKEVKLPKPAPKPPAPKPTPPPAPKPPAPKPKPVTELFKKDEPKKPISTTSIEQPKPTEIVEVSKQKDGVLGLTYKTLLLISLAIGGTYFVITKK